jgi:predicted transposase YbfD/YdcC
MQQRFTSLLAPGAAILDFGCGSGRDTKAFLDAGFDVTATDGSPELCAIASEYAGIPVRNELFQDLADVDAYEVSEKGHGRVETRSYTVSTCEGDARDMLPDSWVHAVCVGRCVHVCTRAGKTTTETHYYVLSRQVSARELARLSRSHWQIENCLHWVLDVIFGEDTLTNREDASISNLSALRKVAFNMTKMLPEAEGLTGHNREDLFTIRPDLAARLFLETMPSEALKGKGSRDDK